MIIAIQNHVGAPHLVVGSPLQLRQVMAGKPDSKRRPEKCLEYLVEAGKAGGESNAVRQSLSLGVFSFLRRESACQ